MSFGSRAGRAAAPQASRADDRVSLFSSFWILNVAKDARIDFTTFGVFFFFFANTFPRTK